MSERFDELTAQRDAILAELEPLEGEAATLRREVDRAERAWRAVRQKIAALEQTRNLRGVCMELAAVARGLKGNHSLHAAGLGERG